jgi:hypothetical protein
VFEALYSVSVKYPEGNTRTFPAFRVYHGKNRFTWIGMDGVRSYVLLRHGFVIVSRNA